MRQRRIILDTRPGSFDVIVGDAIEVLRAVPANSVHCVVTSPPYFGLRDYGTGQWAGGDPNCDHVGPKQRTMESVNKNTNDAESLKVPTMAFKDRCGKCGAKRVDKQIGLEPSPQQYVEKMVALFEEVRRVMRPDATLWLNLGDSYAGTGYGNHDINGDGWKDRVGMDRRRDRQQKLKTACAAAGAKPKDLLGIPWMVAFALRKAGWWLRQDIIFAKPNPMPESVTDRCTKSHEYIFLLTKRPKYYYDNEAIREPAAVANYRAAPTVRVVPPGQTKQGKLDDRRGEIDPSSRNKRSVWNVATRAFSGAHFATFPEDLIAPCILAGTSARGCCSKCGAPHERVVEKGEADIEHQRACGGDKAGAYDGKSTKDYAKHKAQDASATKARILAGMRKKKTVSWQPTCDCSAGVVQCVVLDPFTGSGTTGVVSRKYGRRFIGSELNPEYAAMARRRIGNTPRPLIAGGL